MPLSTFYIPPYWGKIFELNKLLYENPDVKYFIWIDSDATIINVNKLNNLINELSFYNMIISNDIPPWYGMFNDGVFIIKNNDIGRQIISKWITYYNKDMWDFINDTWTCKSYWSGPEYEQGSFTSYILTDDNFNKYIKNLNYYVLNNNSFINTHDDTICVHLAGFYKNEIKEINYFYKNIMIEHINNTIKYDIYWINVLFQIYCVIIIWLIVLLIICIVIKK